MLLQPATEPQQSVSSSSAEIPLELGESIQEYLPKRWWLYVAIAGGMFLIGGLVVILAINLQRGDYSYIIPPAIGMLFLWITVIGLIGVIYFLPRMIMSINLRTVICENGFVYQIWGKRFSCLWTDVEHVIYLKNRHNFIGKWTTYYCQVIKRDGSKITFPSPLNYIPVGVGRGAMNQNARLVLLIYLVIIHVFFRDPLRDAPELFSTIRKNVTKAQLPQVSAALSRGESVALGELEIGPNGITHQGSTLPWERLDVIEIGGGNGIGLVIASGMIEFFEKRRKSPWLEIHSLSVPNYDVLMVLAKRQNVEVVDLLR